MTFQKGQSGNPKGRAPAGETFADMLRGQLTPETRTQLAAKAITMGIAGSVAALVFIRDTLDGRPAQALEHSGPGGKPILMVLGPRDADSDEG